MKREGYPALTLLYLAGFAAALWIAAPFFGWGGGPEMGLGLMSLGKVSLFGYPLAETVGRLAAFLPTDAPEFSSAVAGAVLLGLTLVFICMAVEKLSGSAAASVLASGSFLAFPGTLQCFQNVSPDGWTLFLTSAIAAASINHFKQPSRRSFALMSLLIGAGILHHGFLLLAGLGTLALAVVKMGKRERPAAVFSGFFFTTVGLIPSVFLVLRPPIFVNWSSPLAPWLGEFEPVGSIPNLLLGGLSFGTVLSGGYQLAQVLSGAYLPLLAAAAVGFIFQADRKKSETVFVWGLLGLAMLFELLGARSATSFHLTLFILFLSMAGAHGLSVIFAYMFPGREPDASAAAKLVFLALAAVPVFLGIPQARHIRADGTRDFLFTMLKSMRRDALLVADAKGDPLYGLGYLQQYRGMRRDVAIIFPEYFPRRAYRKYLRSSFRSDVLILNEDQYKKILQQVVGMIPQSLGGNPGAHFKERLVEGVLSLLDDYIILRNFAGRPIYFNRIDRLFTSRFYSIYQFMPSGLVFFLRSEPQPVFVDEVLAAAVHKPFRDQASRRLVADYFENIGENFFKQERWKTAADFFEAGAKLDPDNIPCNFFLGLIYKQFGRYDDAVTKFKAVLRLLKKKELSGVRDNMDILMYERIYTELNMPQKAEKYRLLVEPEGMPPPLPPGMIQP